MIKRFLLFITFSLTALFLWMIWNMSLFSSKQIHVDRLDLLDIYRSENMVKNYSPNKFIDNLSESIKYKTISYEDSSFFDPMHFLSFHKFLERAYPLIFNQLEKRTFSNYMRK